MPINDSQLKPSQLTFENLSKQFMNLVSDRYPTAAKVIQAAERLGVENSIPAKIVVISQFRDAIRQVSAQIYKSPQHRDDLFNAILEALEKLEDDLEDQLDQEEEED